MAAQILSTFDAALKIDYLPVIREQLNNAGVLSSKIERNERDVQGKQWQITTHTSRNSGVGSGTETGLPTAGYQSYANPYGNVKYTRGRISVSGRLLKLGPLLEQFRRIITFLNSVDLLEIGQYRANRIYAEV